MSAPLPKSILDEVVSLADAALLMGMSERRLRKVARECGCCREIGKTMLFLESDLSALRQILVLQHQERSPSRVPISRGNVYFLECQGMLKIGFARNVKRRIAAIQSTCPHPAVLLHSMRAKFAVEAELHQRFAAYRSHGEWFRYEGELREYVESLRK